MIGNGVQFSLEALDNITPLLQRIKADAKNLQATLGHLGGAGNEADALKGKTDRSTTSMLAFGVAAGIAAAAVGKISSAFSSALEDGMKFQTMSRVVASDIQMSLGGTMGDNQKMLLGMQKQLAKDAANLPGNTSDYNTMLNAVSQSVAMANEGNADGFKSDAMDIAKRSTILATVRGVNVNDSGGAMAQAINGGRGIMELLQQIDLFSKSPVLKSGILKGISDAGLTPDDWKEMTTKQRKDIVQQALKQATPDTLIKEFESTTESVWQGIVSGITDPLSGSFGVLREVGDRNNRTVMTTVFDLLKAFNQMTGLIGEVTDALGLSFDPMAIVIDMLDFVAGIFNNISYIIARAKEKKGGLESFSFGDFTKGIAEWLNEYIKNAVSFLQNLNGDDHVNGAWSFLTGILDGVTAYAKALDYQGIGIILGEVLGNIVRFVFSLPNWIRLLGSIWNLVDTLGNGLGGLIVGLVKGLLDALIVKPIKSSAEAFSKTVTDLFVWLMTPFKAVTDAVQSFIEGAKGLLNLPGSIVQGIASAPGNAIKGAAGFIGDKAKDANDWLKSNLGFDIGIGSKDKPVDPANPVTPVDPLNPLAANSPTPITPLTPQASAGAVNTVAFAPVTTVQVADGSNPHPDLLRAISDQLGKQYQEFKSRQLGTGFA
jgi:hypothetical protein